jgi:ubiquinone/menaquinone biosynthesis C-methylase UbiE
MNKIRKTKPRNKQIQSLIQVEKSHYFNLCYDSKERWSSYWYQIHEVLKQSPKSVLEIGVGNKTVSDYLQKIGIKVTTCDFDKNLDPDVTASVLDLPFKENSFDVVLCAEVLEHLPFNDFQKALKEILKVTRSKAILTLPHLSLTHIYFGGKFIPYVPKMEVMLKIDYPFTRQFNGEHYWEIGEKRYSLNMIIKTIRNAGFKMQKTYYPSENPRHQFFILQKNLIQINKHPKNNIVR